VAQLAAPFAITARAADEVKFGGLNDPLTGTYVAAALCWRSARMSGARAFEDHVCALAGASAEAWAGAEAE
jgi:hypothetical protein